MAPNGSQPRAAQRRPGVTDAVEYERPAHPLNAAAQRRLDALYKSNKVDALDEHLKQAIEQLTDAAMLVNDRYAHKAAAVEREDKSRLKAAATATATETVTVTETVTAADERSDGPEGAAGAPGLQENGDGDGEQAAASHTLEEMATGVRQFTRRLDERLRKMIDCQMTVTSLERSLRVASNRCAQSSQRQLNRAAAPDLGQGGTHGGSQGGSPSQTANVTSQTQAQAQAQAQASASASAPSQDTEQMHGPLHYFRDQLEQETGRYEALSPSNRYSKNNAYIGFKRAVHDAQHPDDGKPLPHPSAWFGDDRTPAHGENMQTGPGGEQASAAERVGAGGGDDDDDIAIESETVSTKCPLTLQSFKDPLRSRNCPHCFEKEAIFLWIRDRQTSRQDENRRRPRDGPLTVPCPVSGCNAVRYVSRIVAVLLDALS